MNITERIALFLLGDPHDRDAIEGADLLNDAAEELATITQQLAEAREAKWRVMVPTPTMDDPERMFEFEIIAIDHQEHVITVSAYAAEIADIPKSVGFPT